MKWMGKWVAAGVLLATSLIWLFIGLIPQTNYAIAVSFLAVNGMMGFGLGYMFDRVHAASLRDDLTQAYNRRFLSRKMPSLMARAGRRNGILSITLIDCDNFKKINDQYGHHTGDSVLQCVSRLLVGNIRRDDYVVRWGGDEFLVIAEHEGPDASHFMIDRLNKELRQLAAEMNMPLSVSAGTAVYPTEASKLEDLIRIADYKLYESKHTKKDAAVS